MDDDLWSQQEEERKRLEELRQRKAALLEQAEAEARARRERQDQPQEGASERQPVRVPALPETQDLKELARSLTSETVKALYSIVADETQSASARVSAANTILDRGHGRTEQGIAVAVERKIDADDLKELGRYVQFAIELARQRGDADLIELTAEDGASHT